MLKRVQAECQTRRDELRKRKETPPEGFLDSLYEFFTSDEDILKESNRKVEVVKKAIKLLEKRKANLVPLLH